MKVYHASTVAIEAPDVLHSRDCLDFGRGFYVTTIREQAVQYAERFTLRGMRAFVNEYDLDAVALARLQVKRFERYDSEWLSFVVSCRSGNDEGEWDAVIGGVANDRVFRTIELYFSGEISAAEALGRLEFERPNDQICLRTQVAIDCALAFTGAEEVA